jgi:hypothetical protein
MRMSDKDKRSFKRLVDRTKKNAYNSGKPWTDDDVAYLVNAIAADDTTYNMAMGIGRSYYSVQTARSHVRFAMNHQAVLYANNVTSINSRKRA